MTHHTDRPIIDLIQERRKQDTKWGEQNHSPTFWLAILMEEVGEAAKGFLQNDPNNYREELVQIAAVTVAAIESYDRNKERDVFGDKWKAQ